MKKWVWIGVAVLICIAAAGIYFAAAGGTAVQVATISKGEIKQYLEDTAVVLSKDKQTVYVEGIGKITGIRFDVGDSVKKDDILITLDKADFQLQLKDANAKVNAAREQIRGADASNYADKIEAARASVEQAKVAYDSAQKDYENAKLLYEAGSLSKVDLDKTQDSFKSTKAELDSANAQLADIKRGTPDYLRNTYISQLEQALVLRDTIKRSIDKQQVKAPISGIILEKYVEDGSPVTAGVPVFLIGNLKNLELEADILADDCSDVRIGNQVEISGESLGKAVLKGQVSKIAPSAKTITSTLGVDQKRVPVTIKILDEKGALKPGYTVDIKIITADKKQALTVPDSSVFDYRGDNCVLTVEHGKTIIRPIKTGLENDDSIEVLEGLKEGDSIVVKPDNTIKEGMRVKPTHSSNSSL